MTLNIFVYINNSASQTSLLAFVKTKCNVIFKPNFEVTLLLYTLNKPNINALNQLGRVHTSEVGTLEAGETWHLELIDNMWLKFDPIFVIGARSQMSTTSSVQLKRYHHPRWYLECFISFRNAKYELHPILSSFQQLICVTRNPSDQNLPELCRLKFRCCYICILYL